MLNDFKLITRYTQFSVNAKYCVMQMEVVAVTRVIVYALSNKVTEYFFVHAFLNYSSNIHMKRYIVIVNLDLQFYSAVPCRLVVYCCVVVHRIEDNICNFQFNTDTIQQLNPYLTLDIICYIAISIIILQLSLLEKPVTS
eukprot:GHVS01014870.1.p1 GENE.GHVS01014870.1~~GHVS01014870.1.p1  ORF type:complete len:140 (-),score=1.81 GHVS01014870.1:150-569(-)